MGGIVVSGKPVQVVRHREGCVSGEPRVILAPSLGGSSTGLTAKPITGD